MSLRHVRGPQKYNDVTVKTSSGNVTMTNEAVVIVKKDSGAATTVTLPASPARGQCAIVLDGKGDAATNNITVQPASGNIDGSGSYAISENYAGAEFLYGAGEWKVRAAYKANASQASATLTNATITTATITTGNITNATVSGLLNLTDVASVNAAGTVIANATAITHTVNLVAGADDAKGVILPTAVAGKTMLVYSSQGTNGLKVYPAVNGTINDGSANAAIVIEGKTLAMFVATNAVNWASIFTVNS